jgi:dTDP-4-amino-4,6-dideoxygalactose transaminase
MSVPAFNLQRAHKRIAEELQRRWQRILDNTSFVQGPEVSEFEAAFAQYLGVEGAVGVANGTDALVVALRALGVEPGDEVLVPAFTFYATAEAVLLVGAVPVFCDVDGETLNLDPEDAARRLTDATVGIIGVHLYGRPFDSDRLGALAERHDLWLMEDAAQAQGAAWRGKRVGGLGTVAAWSFYPSKNLGCFGDGGAVTANDPELLTRIRRIANHGQVARYEHVELGTNSRLDSLQAAVLNCRLPLLEADNARRREIACKYHGGFGHLGDVRLPKDPEGAVCVYHQYTVRTRRRDELQQFLKERGVGTAVHYPTPLHRQAALTAHLDMVPTLPVAEEAAAEVLSLPMFPELTEAEVEETIAAVRAFYGA